MSWEFTQTETVFHFVELSGLFGLDH